MAVQIDLLYNGQLNCQAIHAPSRCQLSTDAPLDNGGQGKSFSPTDLVATALGSCMLTVMGLVAQRENFDMSGTKLTVVKEMVAKPRRKIAALQVQITFPPQMLIDAEQKLRLEEAALFCPVQQSLDPDIAMPVEFIYLANT